LVTTSADPATAVSVWDIVVRTSHWLLVACVALAWFTSEGYGAWHEYVGYTALVVTIIRICWGFTGSKYARFSQFVRSVPDTIDYARSVIKGIQKRYVGHNPLAGWMAVALLTMVILTCATGWLYTTDSYWGVEWVEDLHETCAYIMLALIFIHLIGAIATSRHHRENLVSAMLHGKKRTAGDHDIS